MEAYRSPFAHLRTISDGSISAYRLIEPDTDVLFPATGLTAPLRPARAAALEPVKFRARNATVSAIEPRRAVTKIVLIAVSNSLAGWPFRRHRRFGLSLPWPIEGLLTTCVHHRKFSRPLPRCDAALRVGRSVVGCPLASSRPGLLYRHVYTLALVARLPGMPTGSETPPRRGEPKLGRTRCASPQLNTCTARQAGRVIT